MDFESIGLIVGLRAEARIAGKLDWRIAIGGGGAEGAARAAAQLLAQGARALVSFGLAGGLDPSLKPGRVLVPRSVLVDGAEIPCDPELMDLLGDCTGHMILGGRKLLETADHKRDAWRKYGAHAVDLESAAVAQAASAQGLPFAVLRVICDPANCALPPAARAAIDQHGVIGFWRVACSIMRAPRQIPDLFALAGDAAQARKALARRTAQIARSV